MAIVAGDTDVAGVTGEAPASEAGTSATAAKLQAESRMFAAHLRTRMRLLLCDLGKLDPATLTELQAERNAELTRQESVNGWFDGFHRDVGAQDLKTDEDRRNYRELPRVLASYEFLRLPLAERVAWVNSVDRYFALLESRFGDALEALVQDTAPAWQNEVRTRLCAALRLNIDLGARFFGRGSETTVAAVYLPFNRTIYFNLHLMTTDEAGFIDAFEHELWHHLLPLVRRESAATNLWWEGLTEVYSEIWRARLNGDNTDLARDADDSVQYPVQAAWSSLLALGGRRWCLPLLADGAANAEREAIVLATVSDDRTAPLERALAAQWAGRRRIDPPRRARLEAVLADWGWKEDDGSPISLANLLTDDQIDAAKVAKVYSANRALLTDLADAQSTLWLQDVQQRVGTATMLAAVADVPALAANLQSVLTWAENPRRVYRPPKGRTATRAVGADEDDAE